MPFFGIKIVKEHNNNFLHYERNVIQESLTLNKSI